MPDSFIPFSEHSGCTKSLAGRPVFATAAVTLVGANSIGPPRADSGAPEPAARARFLKEAVVGHHCAGQALERGLIVRALDARIALAPALTATRADIDTIVATLGEAVDATGRAAQLM